MPKLKSQYKTKAIVLKNFDLFEADKIVTLLSPQHGLIKAVAKGVRRTKSKFGARLEPFSHIDLILYRGRDLDTITQVELVEPFMALRSSLDEISYGSAMLDLTFKIATPGQQQPEAFNLLLSALQTLDTRRVDPRVLLAIFQIKLAVVAGFEPHLSECANCGSGIDFKNGGYFSNGNGGFLCNLCRSMDPAAKFVCRESAAVLPKLIRIKREHLEESKLSAKTTDEIFALSLDYLRYHIDARLRSYEYLDELASHNGQIMQQGGRTHGGQHS